MERKIVAAWIAIVLGFLLLDAVTLTRSPSVWTDEVSYTDPAANLVREGTFTSTAWPAQADGRFWAGNVPGYSVLLAGWLCLGNLSPFFVRSFNVLLLVMTAGILVVTAKRAGWAPTFPRQVLLFLLLVGGHSITFISRGGRPDVAGMLVLAVALAAALRPWPLVLAAAGFVAPFFGLQLLPYAALLAALAGRRYLRPALIFGGSAALGALALVALYYSQGVLEDFRESVFPHLATVSHIGGMNTDFVDPSLVAAVVGLVALAVARQPVGIGFKALFLIPVVMAFIGKYPGYYSWMTYYPVCLCLVAALPPLAQRGRVLVAMLVAVAASGPLVRTVIALRKPLPVIAPIVESVRTDDVVLCRSSPWYEMKNRVRKVYLAHHLDYMSSQTRAAVSAVVLEPNFEGILESLPGKWEPAVSSEHYTLYRRRE